MVGFRDMKKAIFVLLVGLLWCNTSFAEVLTWNFFDEIKEKNSDLAVEFISIKDLEI